MSASIAWPDGAGARTPYAVFSDPAIYAREIERIWRGDTWSFVALEAEIPQPGDYKSTYVGDIPVVVTRTKDGSLAAWVNRCAHRGAKVCRFTRGNARVHTCVYHQWSYDQTGRLVGVPFGRGHKGQAGMPASFDAADHGLRTLRVESYRGLVFASFSERVEALAEYIGPQMRPWVDRLTHRKLTYLGCTRQFARSNWKLYYENVKDPYHASLLHLFHTTFNILRVSMKARVILDARHALHSILTVTRNEESGADGAAYQANNVRAYSDTVRLADPEVLRMRSEFGEPITNHIQTIFPSLVLQQIHNTLACRQVLPKGPGAFELVFHFFGYEDDDAELQQMRVLQANLVGPAGFISMEDTEVTELVQQAVTPFPDGASIMLMGQGAADGNAGSVIAEEILRGFWRGYRDLMGFA
jgi:anthranilate 1,2-dioxygenase large subunit